MAKTSLIHLLLSISHPSWSPQQWLRTLPRKNWHQGLTDLWALSNAIQEKRLLDKLSAPQKLELKKNLSLLYPATRKTLPPLKKGELLLLVESASLRFSDSIGKRASWKEKRTWLRIWLNSPAILKLTESALHSDECIDRVLGLCERRIQQHFKNRDLPKTYQEEALYLDLTPEDLYTPYRVIVRWGKSLKLKGGTQVVDLGSGVGRIPLTLGLLYPNVHFTGIELMKERHQVAEEARKGLRISNVEFICSNAAKKGLPIADYYYFFNPFVGSTLRQVFRQLKKYADHRAFRVAVAQIEGPWNYVRKLDWLKPVHRFAADMAWEGIGITTFGTALLLAGSARSKAVPKGNLF